MRIALLSDIHANLGALERCLADARERGVDRVHFLGDLVGYGAEAAPVLDIIVSHARSGSIVVKGNHDEAIDEERSYFNHAAKAAIDFARGTLSLEQRSFIAALPLIVRDGAACYVHASAFRPERWDYVDSAGAAKACADAAETSYTFCGHVHDQMLYFESSRGTMSLFRPYPGTAIPVRNHRRWVAIVGSVGQPRDNNPAAAYAIFDSDRQELTFLRVAYDAASAAQKIRAAKLPEWLAQRIERGI